MTLILFYCLFTLLSSVTPWTAEGEPLALPLVFSSPICSCLTLTFLPSFFLPPTLPSSLPASLHPPSPLSPPSHVPGVHLCHPFLLSSSSSCSGSSLAVTCYSSAPVSASWSLSPFCSLYAIGGRGGEEIAGLHLVIKGGKGLIIYQLFFRSIRTIKPGGWVWSGREQQ